MDRIGQAYGAGLAGASFDPVSFIKRPLVILRLISWGFSIIVFACISSGSWIMDNGSVCVFNGSSGTCSFGTFIGVVSFLACSLMLAADFYFEKISSVQTRKKVVIGDLAVSGALTFFWFITFCVLANKWSKTSISIPFSHDPPQAAIAFSFFSILSWAGVLLFAFRRYKEGAANAFAPTYDQDFSAAGAPPFYPGVGGVESYQEPPFSASTEPSGIPQYQQPAY